MVNMNVISGNVSGAYNRARNNAVSSTTYIRKEFKAYLMSDDMIYSGGNGTGLSFYLKYAPESTKDNPVVIAKGIDENGKEFEQKIVIKDIKSSNATYVEMHALEAHYSVDKGDGISSLPLGCGDMGLNDRRNFIAMFKKEIQDMRKLSQHALVLFYKKNLAIYENIAGGFLK